jgi:hypothetical protein
MGEASSCSGNGGGYRQQYAAALHTQQLNARDSLQPVLVLAWQGEENSSDPELTLWAESLGAIVVNVPQFTFQAELDQKGKRGGILGAFIRLDIPAIIEEHRLFDLPNVCQPEVLYTDSDVFFMNGIDTADMHFVKQALRRNENAIVAYGPEMKFDADTSYNTGVLLMHVDRFRSEWPEMLRFAMEQEEFPEHDQILMNAYFSRSGYENKRESLPLLWNWKTYWPVNSDLWAKIKVVHTHGPKPERGLWETANCDWGAMDRPFHSLQYGYNILALVSLCCNEGSVANKLRELVDSVLKGSTVCGTQ